MLRRNFFLTLLAVAASALFVLGLVRLLLLRYERGDVYPAYSTLRADPLGTRAYYEALGSVKAYTTDRGYTALDRELAEKPATIFYLGLDADELKFFPEDEVTALDDYVKNGGRIVLTFSPEDPQYEDADEIKKPAAKTKPADAKPPAKEDKNTPPADNGPEPKSQQEKHERDALRREQEENKDEPAAKYHPSLAALWGFGWKAHLTSEEKKPATKKNNDDDSSSDADEEKPEVLAFRVTGPGLEEAVPWKSALYFVRLEPEWATLYDAKGKPVLIRRSWGKGEIIVATDSYLVSNEALRNDRRPALLGFLAGPGGHLLFDETHLGTQEQEGVMVLMKKFRLEGYLWGTLAVVVLFLWRNSAPLVPPRPAGSAAALGGAVSGKDSRSGLVNLLRRNIPPAEILKTSLGEWKRGVTPARTHLHGKMSEMEATLASASTNRPEQIVETYHRLRQINNPGRTKEKYGTKPRTALPAASVRPD